MNRAEVKEIKKLFTIKDLCAMGICGCYVDAEKNIKAMWKQPMLALPENELIKYLDILRGTLSGRLGKNLLNMAFKENDMWKKENGKNLLEAMRESQLKDADALGEYYNRVIEDLEYTGQYAIITVYGAYDIPGKTTDGLEMEDASEEVYQFIMTCVCPVNLQKPGLAFDREKNTFANLNTARILDKPMMSILYPAFNDRSQDTAACLCYRKKADELSNSFIESMTGSRITVDATKERETYQGILQDILGPGVTMDEVIRVEEELRRYQMEHSYDPEPYELDAEDMEDILAESGIDGSRIEKTKQAFDVEAGKGGKLMIDNIVNNKGVTVSMAGAKLVIETESNITPEVRELEGKRVLVLPLQSEVEVNGIRV